MTIVSTPGTVGGAPRIDGTRLTTELIARLVAHRETPEDVAHDYDITSSQVREAIEFEASKGGTT